MFDSIMLVIAMLVILYLANTDKYSKFRNKKVKALTYQYSKYQIIMFCVILAYLLFSIYYFKLSVDIVGAILVLMYGAYSIKTNNNIKKKEAK